MKCGHIVIEKEKRNILASSNILLCSWYVYIMYVTRYYISVSTEIISRWNLADTLQWWRLWNRIQSRVSCSFARVGLISRKFVYSNRLCTYLTQFQNAWYHLMYIPNMCAVIGFVVPALIEPIKSAWILFMPIVIIGGIVAVTKQMTLYFRVHF